MRSPRSAVDWLRARPLLCDGALALAAALLVLVSWAAARDAYPDLERPDVLGVVLTLLCTLPATLRRSHLHPVFGVVVAGELAAAGLHYPGGSGVGALLLLYTAAATLPLRTSLRWLAVTSAALVLVLSILPGQLSRGDWFNNALEFAVAYVLGRAVRNRRLYTAALRERAERAERDREAAARAAVTVERQRIARELHDVVAHNVSVVGVLVAGARRALRRDPDQADGALEAVERTAHETLREMRALLDVLRTDDRDDDGVPDPLAAGGPGPHDPSADLAPQPGVAGVAALVAQVREAGLPVELTIEGDQRPLPPGVELSVYRIVQEALTNTLKHAGPARARVHVRYAADALDIEVADDGRAPNGSVPDGSVPDGSVPDGSGGHGLVGMRERVHLYGGTLWTGPRSGGGYTVRAHLPVQSGT